MNPVALPKPTSEKQPPQKTTQPQPQPQPQSAIPYHAYEGNVQLMEARFLELCSCIRALYRSVGDLREYLLNHPGDDDALLLLQSICENRRVLRKHRAELDAVVEGLKQQLPNGKETFDVPDDIRIMVLDDGNGDGKSDGKRDGPTTTALSSTENDEEEEEEHEHEGPGVYL